MDYKSGLRQLIEEAENKYKIKILKTNINSRDEFEWTKNLTKKFGQVTNEQICTVQKDGYDFHYVQDSYLKTYGEYGQTKDKSVVGNVILYVAHDVSQNDVADNSFDETSFATLAGFGMMARNFEYYKIPDKVRRSKSKPRTKQDFYIQGKSHEEIDPQNLSDLIALCVRKSLRGSKRYIASLILASCFLDAQDGGLITEVGQVDNVPSPTAKYLYEKFGLQEANVVHTLGQSDPWVNNYSMQAYFMFRQGKPSLNDMKRLLGLTDKDQPQQPLQPAFEKQKSPVVVEVSDVDEDDVPQDKPQRIRTAASASSARIRSAAASDKAMDFVKQEEMSNEDMDAFCQQKIMEIQELKNEMNADYDTFNETVISAEKRSKNEDGVLVEEIDSLDSIVSKMKRNLKLMKRKKAACQSKSINTQVILDDINNLEEKLESISNMASIAKTFLQENEIERNERLAEQQDLYSKLQKRLMGDENSSRLRALFTSLNKYKTLLQDEVRYTYDDANQDNEVLINYIDSIIRNYTENAEQENKLVKENDKQISLIKSFIDKQLKIAQKKNYVFGQMLASRVLNEFEQRLVKSEIEKMFEIADKIVDGFKNLLAMVTFISVLENCADNRKKCQSAYVKLLNLYATMDTMQDIVADLDTMMDRQFVNNAKKQIKFYTHHRNIFKQMADKVAADNNLLSAVDDVELVEDQEQQQIEEDQQMIENDQQMIEDDQQMIENDQQMIEDDQQMIENDLQEVKSVDQINQGKQSNQLVLDEDEEGDMERQREYESSNKKKLSYDANKFNEYVKAIDTKIQQLEQVMQTVLQIKEDAEPENLLGEDEDENKKEFIRKALSARKMYNKAVRLANQIIMTAQLCKRMCYRNGSVRARCDEKQLSNIVKISQMFGKRVVEMKAEVDELSNEAKSFRKEKTVQKHNSPQGQMNIAFGALSTVIRSTERATKFAESAVNIYLEPMERKNAARSATSFAKRAANALKKAETALDRVTQYIQAGELADDDPQVSKVTEMYERAMGELDGVNDIAAVAEEAVKDLYVPSIYCGDKEIAPDGRPHGTSLQCFKRGIGVGTMIARNRR